MFIVFMLNVKCEEPTQVQKVWCSCIDPASRAHITATPTLGIVKRMLNK